MFLSHSNFQQCKCKKKKNLALVNCLKIGDRLIALTDQWSCNQVHFILISGSFPVKAIGADLKTTAKGFV